MVALRRHLYLHVFMDGFMSEDVLNQARHDPVGLNEALTRFISPATRCPGIHPKLSMEISVSGQLEEAEISVFRSFLIQASDS